MKATVLIVVVPIEFSRLIVLTAHTFAIQPPSALMGASLLQA